MIYVVENSSAGSLALEKHWSTPSFTWYILSLRLRAPSRSFRVLYELKMPDIGRANEKLKTERAVRNHIYIKHRIA